MKIEVDYKIDKGVPIPVRKVKLPPIKQLQIGESIEFNLIDRGNVQSIASRYKRKIGYEYTIKRESEDKCRIWRIK